MKEIFNNGQWRIVPIFDDLRVYGVEPLGSTLACRLVAKLAHGGDADAIWTIMMCPNDPWLVRELAAWNR